MMFIDWLGVKLNFYRVLQRLPFPSPDLRPLPHPQALSFFVGTIPSV